LRLLDRLAASTVPTLLSLDYIGEFYPQPAKIIRQQAKESGTAAEIAARL